MLGHKWEKVTARVVGLQGGGALPAPGSGPSMGMQEPRDYVVEIRKPSGELLRTTVSETGRFMHSLGSPMAIEINFKTGEAKIDPHGMAKLAQEMLRYQPSAAAGIPDGGAAGLTGAIAGLVNAIGTTSTVTQSVHVIGPNGQEIPAGALGGEDITGLVHAMMSGDPAAKQAAMERIRQLKEQISQRAGADAGYRAPGSTFDPIGPAETFSGPVTAPPPGQSFAPGSFSQFSSPGQYGPANPPASFGAPMAFDPFGAATGQGSPEQRIATLQQLLDKGILTESEFQAKRQQIINEI
jgi:hypothetical protein